MPFISELRNLGLSDKEARVYLASLQLGKSTAHEIAQQAKVNRATTYVIADALIKMGMMSSFEQDEKTYFTAESPDRLMSLIKLQEQELREKENNLNTLLPELKSLYSAADSKPKVKFFEGVEGLKAIQDECLKTKSKEVFDICCLDSMDKLLPETGYEYTPRRVKKGIKSKFIYVSRHGRDKKLEASDKRELRESRYISFDEFPFETDIAVFDNKVSIESYDKKIIAVLIEDKGIAASIRALFEFLWNKTDKAEAKSKNR